MEEKTPKQTLNDSRNSNQELKQETLNLRKKKKRWIIYQKVKSSRHDPTGQIPGADDLGRKAQIQIR